MGHHLGLESGRDLVKMLPDFLSRGHERAVGSTNVDANIPMFEYVSVHDIYL